MEHIDFDWNTLPFIISPGSGFGVVHTLLESLFLLLVIEEELVDLESSNCLHTKTYIFTLKQFLCVKVKTLKIYTY